MTQLRCLSVLLGLLIMTPLAARATSKGPLPAHLTLRYSFAFDGWTIGRITKTLTREPHGAYQDAMTARTVGLARLLTHVVLADQGTFRIISGTIQPLSYFAIRRGDSKPYHRYVAFDWPAHSLVFGNGQRLPLPPRTQDEESVFYAFMLDPLLKGSRNVSVTNGATLTPYRFLYRGQGRVRTPAGVFDTIKILRLNPAELRARQACRALAGRRVPRCLRRITRFTIWVAPRLHDLAVKLRKKTGSRTLTIALVRLRARP